MNEPAGVPPQPPHRRSDRLFGAAAQPSAPRPERPRTEAPRTLRWAAVVVLQLLLAALAYTTAFEAGQPAVGIPVLVLVALELYLLATPESRLAYLER